MSVFWVILSSLATWRIASIVSREEGPLDIFEKTRLFLGSKGSNHRVLWELYKGIVCLWCNSVWWAAFFALFLSTNFIEWLIATFAISTLAIIVEEKFIMIEDDNG